MAADPSTEPRSIFPIPYVPAPLGPPYPGALPQSAPGVTRYASLRVGDAERTAVCDSLATHFAEGRLSPDELDARLAAATGATTRADLSMLLADLPLPLSTPAPRPGPIVPLTTSRFTGMDLLVTMTVICSAGIILLMMLVLAGVEPAVFIASAFGGTLALVTGAGTVHLIHRAAERRRPPAA